MKKLVKILLPVLLFIAGENSFAQFYNGMQMEFGKNRVQHDEFLWTYYRFDQYDIYFYTGGREIAQYTARSIEKHIQELEALFDYQFDEKLQVIVYNKYSHFKQSNIGLAASSEYNVGGETRLAGSKLFVYFEGDHVHLDRQIRAGVAEVLVNEMMYGGNWHEVLRNSTLLNIPPWYYQGLLSYASTPWEEVESRVRDGVMSGRFLKFNHLTGSEAGYAGHALWHYIAQTYGPAVISNILYMTRVSRNIESGFLFVLGTSLRSLTDDWLSYYYNRYDAAEQIELLPADNRLAIKTKKARTYYEPRLSPDGTKLAVVSNELGQRRVYLYDVNTGKKKQVWKHGHKLERINDFTYPLLNWHPGGELLAILAEEKGEMILNYYNINTGKTEARPIFLLDQVTDFSYSDDGKLMVFSAVANGQSDIYIYNITSNTQQQVTKDGFDDLHPRFTDNSTKIVFASNRSDDTIRFETRIIPREYNQNKDLFVYDIASSDPVLQRLTNTPGIDEFQPMPYKDGSVLFLSDRGGTVNRYLAVPDSEIAFIDTATHYRYFTRVAQLTEYPRSILEHEVNRNSWITTDMIFHEGRYRFFREKITTDPGNVSFLNSYETAIQNNKRNTPVKEESPSSNRKIVVFDEELPPDTSVIDINNYSFSVTPDSSAGTSETPVPVASVTTKVDTTAFKLPEQRNYNIVYYPERVTTSLDFGFLNQAYQPFMGAYYNPGISGNFKLSISDLFEDHRISGVIHPSLNFSNSQYLLSYENRVKRLDKQFVFHRQGVSGLSGTVPFKMLTNEARVILRWPFSEVASIRGSITGRYDKLVVQTINEPTLQEPDYRDYWAILKAEYIFDNTLNLGLNLYRGTRLKFFAEQFKLLNESGVDMTVVGTDIRHYTRIHRTLIWANRLAASSSFGSNKLIYYLGGVDSWIAPRFNNQTSIDFSQNYAYQALATNMRGFEQNARNGKSFAVINSEIRLPLFRYLTNRPIRSDFINNFQVVGFGDVGAAWNGWSPYSEENSFNTTNVITNNLIIKFETQKEPIIGGYGFGLRSRIWGYFVRADWAWGVEDYEVKPRMFYLSLSLDF